VVLVGHPRRPVTAESRLYGRCLDLPPEEPTSPIRNDSENQMAFVSRFQEGLKRDQAKIVEGQILDRCHKAVRSSEPAGVRPIGCGLRHSLLRALPNPSGLILVGDVDQPPVRVAARNTAAAEEMGAAGRARL
jgi:hypothetical protein